MSRSGGPGFRAGVVLGGLVGAGLALLFAPRSGEETRRELSERAAARSVERGNGPRPEALDVGVATLETALERLESAMREARSARVAAQSRLEQEWTERKAGRSTPAQPL